MSPSRADQPGSEINQLTNPYMSTIELTKIISSLTSKVKTELVLDLGCGIGAQSIYFANSFPDIQFLGLDYNRNHIEFAQNLISKEDISNLTFEVFDLLSSEKIQVTKAAETSSLGLISIHTLCCFKNFEPFFEKIVQADPDWIVVNSLFCHGPLEVLIHIRELDNLRPDADPDSDFNIFSKELVTSYLEDFGYRVEFQDFYPEKILPAPETGRRGTYTVSTDFHPRTQFSGPVHLPWSFLIANKN
jgi:SAM-dependent methyltransferase